MEIKPSSRTNEYIVEFENEDGASVSIVVENDNPGGYDEDYLIGKARAMLARREADGNLQPEMAHQQPAQPEGPVPKPNPLLEEQGQDGHVVRVKGEGFIDP
ncbi:hypothetical protein [Phyllobacterium endophyticum]|uniref:hypothetical protein n=1 Tax=Phyllobacterium endophyticum TaxID=1149773 RepID=UPI0011C72F16|nr:hypothetical protein [Phyllobacterium endophyticum]TXR47248.1 hypothetical protein FVA77_21130 [Phyllobacterium endophyticum]